MRVEGRFDLFEYPQSCPSCGADSYVIEMHIGNWRKFVAVCICCPSGAGTWSILPGTLAFQKFTEAKKRI